MSEVWLLLHNALRVDEACAADITDLGEDSGHRVLRVVRKGARKAKALEEQRNEKYRHALIAVLSICVRAGQLGATDA